ncbi:uncharacterized protein [Neodiprion pinetum]|uniref:uncharacterized protein n=1 Tax=Neodiprion pinetum TaxID=441929 RepID=UPI001EE09BA3|nr:uncharacterized protein LOC124216896 [Neodiprion pinetum]XP_046477929.1 uncharacterized protein LOC124216896 [Neodiprion pinetum]XP_046477930.1 uncharacterized protein LOC124216896 [Neodiprion pinetum]XP_046477932.1 uncharacterized protein LOC124216896 [Neodiprion pinetum]XP_046477933.1 uncharacterized protein LOC124216896 [Neodiprion pinetum]XP_046477934.1 uncharacterized protein LOC124216896 [Neodiprion pinetum]XP_046477935.1 uncharacterized protein LOC124216896 [Neodiprion pinetum]XP_0
MPPSLIPPIFSPLLLLLVAADNSWAFNSRQGECTFPSRWEGSWFQSGVYQPITVSRNIFSSKGRCLHNEGDKFLLVDEKSCYRCVVIHEKHPNVLQYKETFCHSRNSLASLCSYITGDALLFSMFREDAQAVPCPFRGPMTFSYNRGHETCSSPQSNVDTCTEDSRLLFRYQACPDIPASESAVEELECLATWKEGSSRYLVGRLHHRHASNNEDRYRCFVYERVSQSIGGLNRASLGLDQDVPLPGGPIPDGAPEIYRVAQSDDATCNGLFSTMEGSRSMTLRKAPSPGKCRFPSWLSGHTAGGLTWHTLDLTRSYTFHPRNASLHTMRSNSSTIRYENGAAEGQEVPGGQDEQDFKILCNVIKQSNPGQTMAMIVAHFTVGCRSGYMCMTFYRRDGHVVEVQTGNTVARPEEACSPPHYIPQNTPYITLVTSSPEPRQCPYLGKFTVTGMNRNQRNTRENRRIHEVHRDKEKVRHAQEKTFEVEARRANNDYLVHERRGRKTRSNRRVGRSPRAPRGAEGPEDLLEGAEDFTRRQRRFWGPRSEEGGGDGKPDLVQSHVDYFGDYDTASRPTKRSTPFDLADVIRPRRALRTDAERDSSDRREKREEEESGCVSEVTTLTVGCSTADRMEFQGDCVDDDTVTAYSCHGRWFDTEGTQFVIATPLATRRTAWSNDNNRPQPFRNSRRLCFMYRESGGVVSLTASPVACQRGVPPPPPMLAFNATSIGQCVEDNAAPKLRTSGMAISLVITIIAIFR